VGDIQDPPFHLSCKALWNANFEGLRVTSDGALIFVRELNERFGLGELVKEYLTDARVDNARSPFADPLRQSVSSRLPGNEYANDVGRPCQDPTLWLINSKNIWDQGAALP
jgi:hypothetical protein